MTSPLSGAVLFVTTDAVANERVVSPWKSLAFGIYNRLHQDAYADDALDEHLNGAFAGYSHDLVRTPNVPAIRARQSR